MEVGVQFLFQVGPCEMNEELRLSFLASVKHDGNFEKVQEIIGQVPTRLKNEGLMIASIHGCFRMVQLILENDAAVDPSMNSSSALTYASLRNNVHVVEVLLRDSRMVVHPFNLSFILELATTGEENQCLNTLLRSRKAQRFCPFEKLPSLLRQRHEHWIQRSVETASMCISILRKGSLGLPFDLGVQCLSLIFARDLIVNRNNDDLFQAATKLLYDLMCI